MLVEAWSVKHVQIEAEGMSRGLMFLTLLSVMQPDSVGVLGLCFCPLWDVLGVLPSNTVSIPHNLYEKIQALRGRFSHDLGVT